MAHFSPPASPPRQLSDAALADYCRDGFLLCRGLLDAADLACLQQVYQRAEARVQAAGGSIHDGQILYQLECTAGERQRLRKVQEIFRVDPDFRRIFGGDRVLDVVADLIGEPIYYHSSKLMCKPALGGRRKPWHQDWAYWSDMDPRQVTVWTAIDPATRANGCMQVLPGSHLDGVLPHHQAEDFMIDEAGLDHGRIRFVEMEPGDVLFFHVLLLHASDPNDSPDARLAAIVDYETQPRPPGHHFGSDEALRQASIAGCDDDQPA